MQTLWKSLRRHLAHYKQCLLNRPKGLKRFGKDSVVSRPWRFEGIGNIEIGARTTIRRAATISALMNPANHHSRASIVIGDDVYIGNNVFISAVDEIIVGHGCVLSDYVYITDVFHGTNPEMGPIMKQPVESKGHVRIGPNSFVGYRVSIMPGVTLGEWTVVGTNSVVSRSFPAFSMIAGSPARLIKSYSHQLHRWVSITSDQAAGPNL